MTNTRTIWVTVVGSFQIEAETEEEYKAKLAKRMDALGSDFEIESEDPADGLWFGEEV